MNIIQYRKDKDSPWQSIPALKGDKGDKGDPGETPDLSGYATVDYVDEAVGNVDISDVDLSGYAKTTDIPDVSSFQTATQVQQLINASMDAIGIAEEGEY